MNLTGAGAYGGPFDTVVYQCQHLCGVLIIAVTLRTVLQAESTVIPVGKSTNSIVCASFTMLVRFR